MSDKIEDLTIDYVEDGVKTVKELDKVILTKGAWCTILFKFQSPLNSLPSDHLYVPIP